MWAVTAIVAVSAISGIVQADKERDAKRDAEQKAKQDRADALRSEQFADTEGEGQGMLGNINLAIDEDVDDEVLSGKSNISI
jgi:hypothetical protein